MSQNGSATDVAEPPRRARLPCDAHAMTRAARVVAALLSTCLMGSLLGLLPATAAAGPAPREGSLDGIGDAYFPQDGNRGIDVLHYDVHARYTFGSRRLSGRTVLRVRATQRLTAFHLDLLLPVRRVLVDGVPAAYVKPTGHELRIVPRRPIPAGAKFRVRVEHAGHPGRLSYAGERNFLASAREVVVVNEPHMAPWWFAANDHPSDKARFDLHLTVPRGKQVLANGKVVSRRHTRTTSTVHWRERDPMATYGAFFVAGSFREATGTTDGVPWRIAVSRLLPAAHQQRILSRLRVTPQVVRYLSRKLGRYPFQTSGGIAVGLPLGFALENQSRPVYDVGSGLGAGLVAHEQAHQWLGDSVSLRRWRDIWLNEGLATYLEWTYEFSRGDVSPRERMRELYDAVGPGWWALPIGDPGPGFIFAPQVYLRGAMTAQALRNRIGSEAFWRVLRTWVARHRHGTAGTAQFIALAEQASGRQLDGFFDAWLHGRTRPPRTAAYGLG